MPEYRLPTWNVLIGIWHPGVVFVPLLAPLKAKGQLYNPTPGGLSWVSPTAANVNAQGGLCYIKVPIGTDIRRRSSTFPDYDWLWNTRLEIMGTGRLYAVMAFEDVAAGFVNEYRRCIVTRMPPDATPLPPVFGTALPIPDGMDG